MLNVLRGAAVFLLWTASAAGAVPERIYILSQDGAMLVEIVDDADGSGETVNIALDKAPASLALAPDAPLAYVTHADLGQISVVDLNVRRVVRRITLPGSPFGIAAGAHGRLYVGDWHEGHVTVVETAGEERPTLTRVGVGRAPGHVALTADGAVLFVANRESDSVSAIRSDDLSVQATISVGHAPFALALSPDNSRLYVGNVQGGSVTVIDTASLSVAETWKTGAMPYGAAVTPDNRLLVTHQGSGTVGVFSGSETALAAIKVGDYPEGIAIGRRGARAYVANWFSDDVSVVDLETLKEIRRIQSPAGPRAIAVRSAP